MNKIKSKNEEINILLQFHLKTNLIVHTIYFAYY